MKTALTVRIVRRVGIGGGRHAEVGEVHSLDITQAQYLIGIGAAVAHTSEPALSAPAPAADAAVSAPTDPEPSPTPAPEGSAPEPPAPEPAPPPPAAPAAEPKPRRGRQAEKE